MAIPRSEYPRPQMVRNDWLCLNGPWQFEIDPGDSGLPRGLRDRQLVGEIIVPFCPESEMSGVADTDYLNAVWYRREVQIPADWAGRDVLLHFQAIDYDATVWANCVEVGRHRGGFTPLTCPLAGVAAPGETVTLVVRARDDHRRHKPRGKQSCEYANRGCNYTRTTGIWQSVWMEPVSPRASLQRPRITPDLTGGRFEIVAPLKGRSSGLTIEAELSEPAGQIASASVACGLDLSPRLALEIPAPRRRAWTLDDPHLYDIHLRLRDERGEVIDQIRCYAGLRGVSLDGGKVLLNGKPVFQRLVLDQGYYAESLMTAPSDEALVEDIELSKRAGFNGARLHQKVFEERFLFHADRMGYLVWGEFGDWSWGFAPESATGRHDATMIAQWLEALERDYNHPSIVGWCPLNETHNILGDEIRLHDDVMRGMFLATKAMDPTRPVLDTSGYSHRVREADIYDSHDYSQDPAQLAKRQAGAAEGNPFINDQSNFTNVPYGGQPYFVSEFGGIWWNADESDGSWGYGDRPKDIEEFYTRFEKLCGVLLDNPGMFGYCYTQLTDVFQEANGIYSFDREVKFDMNRIRAAQVRPAAIERD